jgi:hypothetical protein
MNTKKRTVTVNAESKLFCIPEGTKYYSCLGFDVLETRANALARELSAKGALVYEPKAYGTLSRYEQYRELCEIAYDIHKRTGWRSSSELAPQLIGLEGKRVQVTTPDGNKRRFYVGKSTGFIPCHLEIARRNCYGGMAVYGAPFTSVEVVR